jgi:hypothetical protein
MAEPIVRSFVIDTTQAEQNLKSLDAVTSTTNAALDTLYNQLISLDAQLQKLDPNSQAFAEVNTQIQQLETTISEIETGKIDDIGKAIESIDAGNAANSIEQVGNAVEQVVAPVNQLASATDQLNNELKETKVDTSSIETASADFQELAVEQEQVTTSSKSLKAQLRELQQQLAATDPKSDKYVELSQRAGELKDAIGDAAEAVGTQAGSAFERLGNSAGLLTGRLANLDFAGAAEGAKLFAQNISSIKFSDITSGIKSLGGTLASVGKALLTNPIFLIGAALAVAIDYTSQFITGLDGISEVDQKNLEIQKEKAALAKQQVDAISQQEETLKRQGLTEKQITDLKLKALDTAILEQQVVIETSKTQAAAQNAAAERNFKYLKGFLDFVTLPQKKLTEFFFNFYNRAVDVLNKLGLGIEKVDVGKIVAGFDDVTTFLTKKIFDPEETRKEGDKVIQEAETTLRGLTNQRDGILNAQDAKEKATAEKNAADRLKIEQDLAKQLLEARRKVFEESKKLNDAIRKDQNKPLFGNAGIRNFDAEINAQRAAEDARLELLADSQEKEIALVDQKYIKLRDQYKGNAEMQAKLAEANQREVNAIVEKGTKQQIQLNAESFQKGLEFAQQGLNALSNLTDVVFANKLSKVKKGSKEEEALAKKQFKFQKALQLGGATIDAAKAINASLASAPVAIGPVPNPAGIASLALATVTGAASIAKIAATKFEGGGGGAPDAPTPSIGSGGADGGGAAVAQFNPLAASFLQDRPEQLTPRAYVLAGDVASQQEVREKVQDLARIG